MPSRQALQQSQLPQLPCLKVQSAFLQSPHSLTLVLEFAVWLVPTHYLLRGRRASFDKTVRPTTCHFGIGTHKICRHIPIHTYHLTKTIYTDWHSGNAA